MAVYNRAVGMPDYSSSAGGYFIPELWSPRIQVKFYAKSVFREIANTMYEGEIKKFGDIVNIRTYPSITIGNYVKGQALDIQVPSSTPTSLTINKGKYQNRYCYRVIYSNKRMNCGKPNCNTYGNPQLSQKYTLGKFRDYQRDIVPLMTGISVRLHSNMDDDIVRSA